MILIDNILLSEDILTTKFSCILSECKGACCTFPGEFGAPLIDEEVQEIEQCVDAASEYLSDRSLKILKKKGFSEGKKGNLSTICIDGKDCVFVFYEGNVAKCSLEKAYFEGKTKFRKPISCHLFPIRVSDFGGDYLYYAEFPECKPALSHGEKENTLVFESVKEALIRAYGLDWYNFLEEYVNSTKEQNK